MKKRQIFIVIFFISSAFAESTETTTLRKSEQKCEEFKTSNCEYDSAPLIPEFLNLARPGEFPFVALVGFNTTENHPWKCVGAVISERYILTVAHCANARTLGPATRVRLGKLDLSTENDGSQYKDYSISSVIVHPDYRVPEIYNDIALLKTKNAITFTKFIQPACLYGRPNITSDKALAVGFERHLSAENNTRLTKVTLNIFDNKDESCNKLYPTNPRTLPKGIVPSMLCAGSEKGGRGPYDGISGNPLIISKEAHKCQFYVVGITSFGVLYGPSESPLIFARVSEYIDWIEKEVWK